MDKFATCSGDLPPSDRDDLRLLLRIHGQDGIGAIRSFLPVSYMLEFDKLVGPFTSALKSLSVVGVGWKGHQLTEFMPTRHVRMLDEALANAHAMTRHLHQIDGYDKLCAVRDLFSSSEWNGIVVDPSFSSEHVFGGRIHPQIDVIPKSTTGRLGTRGGFNVMAWNRITRSALVPSDGMLYSVDFNAMDLRSLFALDPELHSLVSDEDDAYSALISSTFGFDTTKREEVRRIVKSTFLPIVYGANDVTVASTLGVGEDVAKRLRDRYRPFTERLPIGPDLARTVQETSSEAFVLALVAASRVLVGSDGSRALFPVHDELVIESTDADTVIEVVTKMEEAASSWSGVKYKIRLKVGENYGNMEEL